MSLSLNTGSGSIFGMDQETSTTTTPTTGKLDLSQDLNGLNRQAVSPPSNLLVLFLQACSAILQETKIENTYDTIKMFSIILVCITEDTYANSLIHDSSALYSVFLYQAVSFFVSLVTSSVYFDHGKVSYPLNSIRANLKML